jgi:hypothetical protein
MTELTWIPSALRAMAWLYPALALFLVWLAWTRSQGLRRKLTWTVLTLALFCALPAKVAYDVHEDKEKDRQARKVARARMASVMALFKQRCEKAGETIHRTVDDVDSVVWMKWRELGAIGNADQYRLDDPHGRDCAGEHCIQLLMRVTEGQQLNPKDAARLQTGYRFVESRNPNDGLLYRYVFAMKLRKSWTPEVIAQEKASTGKDPGPIAYGAALDKHEIEHLTARYGITWEDLSTKEDRDHWIAGGAVRIIDLQTNEVIAERVGYMIDLNQGSTAGGRAPWDEAVQNACPSFPRLANGWAPTGNRTSAFIFSVLKPPSP